jgi:hypothetical protein
MKVNLANLQVVIFSRNRQEQLIESLRYWDNCGIETLVLHNTQQPLKPAEIPSSTEYIVHEGPFAERCEIASKVLKFDYFIIASDDERYLPTALSNMVKELEENEVFASVGGQAIGIMKYGLRYRTTLAYKSQINYQNLNPEFQNRIIFHYEGGRNYSGAMYRIFRREHFERFLKLTSKFSNIGTPYIFEVTSELFWTLIGPAKYVHEVFWVRNWVVPPVQTSDWDRRQYFYEWSQDPKYKKEFEFWKRIVSNEFNLFEENSAIFETVVRHRMIIEKQEQQRNKKMSVQRFSNTRKIARIISSVFKSKYQQKELNFQSKNLGLEVRNDELVVALISITT